MEVLYQYKIFLSRYSKTTQKVYYDNVILYLRYLEEYKGKNDIITICNVSKADIYNYVAYMDQLSKNTKDVRLASVKNFYNFLNADLSRFLFEDIKLFKTNRKLPKILTSQQIDRLLNYYTGRNRLIVYIFLTTGIRLAELQSIRIENINFEKQYFTIKVKGGYLRDVNFPKITGEMIKEYIGDRKEGNLFEIGCHNIQVIIKNAFNDLGISGSTHTLRHTFATIMYKQTRDVLLVRELLGHKTVISTQIYTHLDDIEARNAVNSNPLARWGV